MIKGKYNSVEVIKQNNYKIIQKCQKQDGSIYIIKSYNLQEKKLIQNEIQTYHILKQPHLYGFPQIKEAFQDGGKIHIVLEELGSNVDKLRYRCGGRLTLKTVLVIGLQILQRIQYLHQNGMIHGDIKPNNFLVGKGKLKHKIYLADFQLCSSYLKNGKHIPQQAKDKFSGSFLFSSRNANSKSNLSRRDDLQSWLYSLIYLCKGELPWTKIQSKNIISANQQFLSLKNNCRDELLSGMPQIFAQLMSLIEVLKFSSTPQYDKLKGLLTKLMKNNGYQLDYKYDWEYL